MSKEYDDYIVEHRKNVFKAYLWIKINIPEIIGDESLSKSIGLSITRHHDDSKFDKFEYSAYDAYFYGGNRSNEVVENFKMAWLIHIHKNPHHWQYWLLHTDDPDDKTFGHGDDPIALDMPMNYIIEMICDWWSFSWKSGNLNDIFDWYDECKDRIILSKHTRIQVEYILDMIKCKLMEEKENDN